MTTMAKTLKDFLNERQLGPMVVKNPDEQKFIDKHVTAKTQDRNGNGDDVFNAANVKKADRKKERHGYEPGEDEKVYEALKGNQHKIDANKNGKVDAHDFHLLRKKKKVAEEAEELEELSKSTMGAYTKKAAADFSARKPKMGYDGQLKKMQNRTVGVNRALDKMYGEEAEQIDELEKKTLGSYIKKASGAERPKNPMNPKSVPITTIAAYQGDSETGHFGKRFNQATYDKAERLRKNRETGIKRATDKLTKEEAEQIDELSATTKDSYAKKAVKQLPGLFNKSGETADGARKYYNRKNAVRKIANEEAEQVDEKLDMKKASMGTVVKDFQKSDAPQFQGKSQKKRQVMAIAAKLSAERGGKPLNKEERLLALLGDLSETHQRTMTSVFDKLNEDNQRNFLAACDTPEGIEQMLDFAIQNRGA
jgi:hypothetical protein